MAETSSLRTRRIDAEWALLLALAAANPDILLDVERIAQSFLIQLAHTPAWVAGNDSRRTETQHALTYTFPRYYPTLPMEGFLSVPVEHRNIDPRTGFLCLWREYRPSLTIVDAVQITRAMLSGKVINLETDHCMQPQAASSPEPLAMPSLVLPPACLPVSPAVRPRHTRRLSPVTQAAEPGESDRAFSHC